MASVVRDSHVCWHDCRMSRACSNDSCSFTAAVYLCIPQQLVGARVIKTQSNLFGPSPWAFISSLWRFHQIHALKPVSTITSSLGHCSCHRNCLTSTYLLSRTVFLINLLLSPEKITCTYVRCLPILPSSSSRPLLPLYPYLPISIRRLLTNFTQYIWRAGPSRDLMTSTKSSTWENRPVKAEMTSLGRHGTSGYFHCSEASEHACPKFFFF